jgi:hypothetical protein
VTASSGDHVSRHEAGLQAPDGSSAELDWAVAKVFEASGGRYGSRGCTTT